MKTVIAHLKIIYNSPATVPKVRSVTLFFSWSIMPAERVKDRIIDNTFGITMTTNQLKKEFLSLRELWETCNWPALRRALLCQD